jgi:5-methylcytosine-specific restriction endonuclease McrA
MRASDLAAVIEQAVNEKLERLEARRFAKTKPRKGLAKADSSASSRHIPAPVRRAVYERDGGRCRYVNKKGHRCGERSRLEYHHRRPFGLGGDRSSENICLMCQAHNQYLAECDYGRAAMAAARTRSESRLRDVSP